MEFPDRTGAHLILKPPTQCPACLASSSSLVLWAKALRAPEKDTDLRVVHLGDTVLPRNTGPGSTNTLVCKLRLIGSLALVPLQSSQVRDIGQVFNEIG